MATRAGFSDERVSGPPAEIAGRDWYPVGGGIFKRCVAPGREPPPEAHAVVPHHDMQMRRAGYRIAIVWVIVAVMVACAALSLLVTYGQALGLAAALPILA